VAQNFTMCMILPIEIAAKERVFAFGNGLERTTGLRSQIIRKEYGQRKPRLKSRLCRRVGFISAFSRFGILVAHLTLLKEIGCHSVRQRTMTSFDVGQAFQPDGLAQID
jgi:hypothetical protein